MSEIREGEQRFPVTENYYKGDDLHPKPFVFYEQDLQGASSVWPKLVEGLKANRDKLLMAVVSESGKLIWSVDAGSHMVLGKAGGIDGWKAQIQGFAVDVFSKPKLDIYSDSPQIQEGFRDYLLRSGLGNNLIELSGSTMKGVRQQLI